MSEALMELRDVRRSFGDVTPTEVLHGISFEIQPGEMIALVGPSGSGKSTLLNQMGLLDRPSAGDVYIRGEATANVSDAIRTALRGRFLGFVFQFHHLLPGLPVIENVMLPAAALEGQFSPVMRERAQKLLRSMGLESRMDAMPRELSGGMQQRVAIARALMNRPALVLADEPTGNLDTDTSESVLNLLQEENEQHETTFVVVTHDPHVAKRCRRELTIVDGQIVSDHS